MVLKTTDDCKDYIKSIIDKDSNLIDELYCHDVDHWDSKRWKRTEKKKIKSDDEVGWILDSLCPEQIWLEKGRTTLVGCTLRGFLHKEADCYVGIITNDEDNPVAWSFQID